MKRTPALAGLSREHHTALVLAQRIAAGVLSAADLQLRFERELAPHFRAEEALLLPLLTAAGATDLAGRTRREHDEMRRLAAAAEQGEGAALAAFAALLREHVRFEERALFPEAETRLSAAQLQTLATQLADASPAPSAAPLHAELSTHPQTHFNQGVIQ